MTTNVCITMNKVLSPILFKESSWKQAIKSQDFSLHDTTFAINKQDTVCKTHSQGTSWFFLTYDQRVVVILGYETRPGNSIYFYLARVTESSFSFFKKSFQS